MPQISQFLRAGKGVISHYCPGCKDAHIIHIEPDPDTGACWDWDHDIVAPSFSPGVLFRQARGRKIMTVCHYTLTDGTITFDSDCTHHLKGVTMRLPPLPPDMRDPCLIP